ncbi:MAG: TatD family hydrolase [Candidatus Colwellbacteria bacterium]|nr:TatD family hydrolase [Candidatus Colwellbacteria bacterium]
MPRLIDVHTHVQFAAFNEDAKEVIDRALANDIWFINVGTQKDTSKAAVEMAEKYEKGVYATIGLHPIHTSKSYHDTKELSPSFAKATAGEEGFVSRGEEFDVNYYKELGKNSKVVAIGECGLDYYRLTEETKEEQAKAFIAQIELAAELNKPLMLHCRNAFPNLIRILNTKYNILTTPAGVVHFFSGTKEDARQLMELGFYFSFGGVITFARDYDEVIKYIGLDRILLETDAPYVAPVPFRGKRNEPSFIIHTAAKLAEILGKTTEEVGETTTKNAFKVFNISG